MVPQLLLQPFWAMARAGEEMDKAVQSAEERSKRSVMGVDVAIKAEDN